MAGSSLGRTITRLEDLGFQSQGFRFHRDHHTETQEVLDPEIAKRIPSPFIFPLYVDLMVDSMTEELAGHLGFTPFDLPQIRRVLDGDGAAQIIAGRAVLPKPEILFEMKLLSIPGRPLNHKLEKDLTDLYALLVFAAERPQDLVDAIGDQRILENARKVIRTSPPEHLVVAAKDLGIAVRQLQTVLGTV